MNRSSLLLVVGLGIGGAGVAVYLTVTPPRRGDAASLGSAQQIPAAAISNPPRRSLESVNYRKVRVFGTGRDTLVNPLEVVVGNGGDIYVFDWGAFSVKRYAADGRAIREYGGRRGQGPGEFSAPTDLAVTSEGQVWVLDAAQARITVFDSSGALLRTIPVKVVALRMAVFPDKQFVLLAFREHLFFVHDSLGHQERSFGRLRQTQEREGLALEGEIAVAGPHRFIYAPLYAGYLAGFDLDGRVEFYTETVQRLPYPPIEVHASGASGVRREYRNRVSTLALSVVGDDLYTLGNSELDSRLGSIIDVYDVRDGSYRRSFPLPETDVRWALVTADNLYTVTDTTVTKWRR